MIVASKVLSSSSFLLACLLLQSCNLVSCSFTSNRPSAAAASSSSSSSPSVKLWVSCKSKPCAAADQKQPAPVVKVVANRRDLLIGAAIATIPLVSLFGFGSTAFAAAAADLPLVSVAEFEKILQESARSIDYVEFSGPRSDTVTVRLVDGKTRFGIRDVLESATDPRSPLRLAALCREAKVPTRFSTIQDILAKSGTGKKVMYTNDRVREAAVKELEKKRRMQQDEEERLAQLYQMQQQQQQQN